MHHEYDYIVVGGGSSGSIVAARLVEAGASVLLLEAGGHDRRLQIMLPATLPKAYEQRNWHYQLEPDSTRNHVVSRWAAGKVFGGSGSINGMVYIRGNAADFNGWAAQGCTGWDYSSVLPYFKKLETWCGSASDSRGQNGPIQVGYQRMQHPAIDAFVDGARQLGHTFNADLNGASQEGVSLSQVNQQRGFRSQSSRES